MDILKTATDWAKAEMFSSAFFVLFGIVFLCVSLGFWQLGKTEVARAYVIPMFAAGILLLLIGLGIFFPSLTRVSSFPIAYNIGTVSFVESELVRTEATLNQYRIAIFGVIPAIIAVCSILIPFVESPIWRACLITVVAMMAVILVIDTSANARLDDYRAKLSTAEQQS